MWWTRARSVVATGHYCRKDILPDGTCRLLAGSDPNKDQSYFLCQISQDQLRAAMFPIGDLCKPEVRRLAHEAELPSADKKDSQGICFVGKVDLPTFLQQKLKGEEGEVVEVFDPFYESDELYLKQMQILGSIRGEDGKPDAQAAAQLSREELDALSSPLDYSGLVFQTETYRSGKKHVKKTRYKANPCGAIIGKHEGAQFYTIGQRKGLAIGGHSSPIFVIATDIAARRIYVGEGESHKGLMRSCLHIRPDEIHWLREELRMEPGQTRRQLVRIRYRQPLEEALLIMREEGLYVLFDRPQRSITAGQFAAWYSPDGELCGSGVISR